MHHYERHLNLLQLDWLARTAPLSLACIITDVGSPRLLLDHPVIRRLKPSSRSITDAQLNVQQLKREEEEDQWIECTWKERLFIVDPRMRSKHPNLRQPVCARRPPHLQPFERQYVLGRVRPSELPALPSVLKLLKGGNEGPRLLSSFTFTDVSTQAEQVQDVTSEMLRLDDDNPPGSRVIGTQVRIENWNSA